MQVTQKDPVEKSTDEKIEPVKKEARQDIAYKEVKEWAQAIITAVLIALLIRTFVFEVIQVDGESMLPTLHHRDRVVVSKISYRLSEPEYEDIIIFRNPENPKVNYVKRVIGKEGDIIEVKNRVVIRNGIELTEDYINESPRSDYGPVEVRKDHLFVMGDNRNHSKDSRDDGVSFIPDGNILGKAKIRVWPIPDITIFQ